MGSSRRLAPWAICVLALAGCSGSSAAGPAETGTTPPSVPSAVASSASPACYAPIRQKRNAYRRVSCTDPAADASVTEQDTARADSSGQYQYGCPEGTDYILDVGAEPAMEVESSGSHPQYACMTTREPPHRGEPGGGDGVITIEDCVRPGPPAPAGSILGQSVLEVRCTEAMWYKPVYQVFQVGDSPCPSSAAFTFIISKILDDHEPSKYACANPIKAAG